MCAMTGLNIQSPVFFGDGVIIWQVFIRMLGYYGTKLAGSIVKNLCKTQESGAAATLPQRGEGISNYNQIIYNNQPSPQPSPTGEEVSNYKMLKQVQHDTNSSKRTYSPIHLFSYSPCKRCAFTLAEVLITLGIIGVVAAMTLPSLIANYRAQQLRTAFLKGYSIITQAFEMYHNDSQCSTRSCIPGNFYQTMKQYFKIVKLCDNNDTLKSEECIPKHTTDSRYKNFSKKTTGISSLMFDDGQFVTTDGMLITFEQQATGEKNIFIGLDVNGRRKSPNVLGQDLFLFQLVDRDGRGFIVPVGRDDTDYPSDEFCNFESTSRENGYGCASRALSEPDFFKKLK